MLHHNEAIIGTEGTSTPGWLRSADVIVGQHRTRRQARRWISSIHHRYPHCVLAVARQRNGRWCLVALPARTIVMRGGRFDGATSEQVGRVIYHLWLLRRHSDV